VVLALCNTLKITPSGTGRPQRVAFQIVADSRREGKGSVTLTGVLIQTLRHWDGLVQIATGSDDRRRCLVAEGPSRKGQGKEEDIQAGHRGAANVGTVCKALSATLSRDTGYGDVPLTIRIGGISYVSGARVQYFF
jgi:hypothetical protein